MNAARRPWLWSVLLVVGVFAVAFGGLTLYNRAMLAKDVDRLFVDVLAEGDADEAYRRADASLQGACSAAEFREFASAHASLFRREALAGIEVRWLTSPHDMYAMVRVRATDAGVVDFYCRHVGSDRWRLVGIAPFLAAAIPPDLREVPTGRR